MMLKPVEVRALPGYRLWIRYADGVVGEVNLSHLVGQGVFVAWQDYQYFESVHIGPGRQIAWGDDLDLCADALYMQITGKQPQEVFPSLQAEAVYA
jgi:hypothetical protein